MNAIPKKQRREQTEDPPRETTIRTQAAVNLFKAAKSMGVLDRLLLVLSWYCGIVVGDDLDLPRPGERRSDKWRGLERENTGSLGHTSTTRSGESSWSDLKARERWRRLEAKEKLRKQQRLKDERSRGD
jgi:hypothetical protein